MLLLDPAYLDSYNKFYSETHNLNIYEYLYKNKIEKEKAKIYLVLEKIWIIMMLFENNKNKYEYDKKYELNQRKTVHIIIYNK